MSQPSIPCIERDHFRAVIEHHPRAFMLATDEPRIIYTNPMFSQITGYSSTEVIGQKPSILSSGVHDRAFYEAMWHTLECKGRWEGLIWNRRKDGQLYPQWLALYRVRGMAGRQLFAGTFFDLADLEGIEEQLSKRAHFDNLTGLPNRGFFRDYLHARVRQNALRDETFALCFVDIDYFKEINALHGQLTGDQVLVACAERLRQVFGERDVVARLSGDEFAVLIDAVNQSSDLETLPAQLLAAFRDPVQVGGRSHFLSLSVGITQADHELSQGVEELFRRAFQALGAAKQDGGGCVRFYDSALLQAALRQRYLSEALRQSLRYGREQFYLHFQPQFCLTQQQLVGVEVLVRWCHPRFGEVSPVEFVPLAEQRGLIGELTACVIERLQGVVSIVDAQRALRLAINVSAMQVAEQDFMAIMSPFLQLAQSRGWQPEIEITESRLMNLTPACLDRLRALAAQGASIAIDDFGTGYSSLAYLTRLPVHVLKIDRQFVHRMTQSAPDSQVIKAIIGTARALDLGIVAEGIETPEQQALLRQLGCCRGQGYLLARPSSWDALPLVKN